VYPIAVQGTRVRLRELDERDAPAVHAWTGDETAVEYVPLGPLDLPGTFRYVRQLVGEARQRPREAYTVAIADPQGDVVGTVSLLVESPTHRRGEIGYILRRDQWGLGYATEAAGLMIDLAFRDLGLNRVWAVCDPDNPASARVMEKVGMRYEGCLRGDLLVRGAFRDSLVFGIVANDWIDSGAAGDNYL
jgi:ribosomal-protein-alanine N-acetyltransferase